MVQLPLTQPNIMFTFYRILASPYLSGLNDYLQLPPLLCMEILIFSAFYAIAYFTKVRTPITVGIINSVFCCAFLATLSAVKTNVSSRFKIERLEHSSRNLADQQLEQSFDNDERIEPNSIAFGWTLSSEKNGFPSRFIEHLNDKDDSETARLISYYKLQPASITEKGVIVFGWDIQDLIHAFPDEFQSFRGNAHVVVYKGPPPIPIYLAVYTDSHLLFLRRGDK